MLSMAADDQADTKVWSGEGTLGFTSSSGNTDSENLNAGLKIAHKHQKWKHNLSLEARRVTKKTKSAATITMRHWYLVLVSVSASSKPTDHGWKFECGLEKLMHKIGMFNRAGSLDLEGFENSGADWMPQYKKYINDGKTIVASPHKVYGPETNDLTLQLRKRGVDQVILGCMSANLYVESHFRELQEQGFEVAVVRDATAAATIPEGDGYAAAIINFRYMANAVWTTDQTIEQINAAS